MWDLVEDIVTAVSDGECSISSDDERDIQCDILEKQRDEADQRLCEIEHVSSQLLKEIDVLEMQFQIERSCRESAEALAIQVTKENKVLKRRSQMLMPLIAELPENMAFDLDSNLVVVDKGGPDDEGALLLSQAKIAELQGSVDRLLSEKLQLEQQVESLRSEQVLLNEQLLLETEEKEALLRTMSKQSRTMSKIKRVSQLVTDEFSEMSERLGREQDLRQHAESLAHQMLVQQQDPSSTETGLRLQQALEQVSSISAALLDIQLYYQTQAKQPQGAVEEGRELHSVRQELQRSEEERRLLQTQLNEAHSNTSQLQDQVKELQDMQKREAKPDQLEDTSSASVPSPPPPPPPPPPPLPPPPTVIINPLDVVRRRKTEGRSSAKQSQPGPTGDVKARAVDEMMERIKRGIVLRPTAATQQEDDSSWKDQRAENRKSAVVELKGLLDAMKCRSHRRAPSRNRISRNIGEGELLMVLQKRRRAIGENQNLPTAAQTNDGQAPQPRVPVTRDVPWAGRGEDTPVLRRLRQNREKRDSHVRASALIFNQEK